MEQPADKKREWYAEKMLNLESYYGNKVERLESDIKLLKEELMAQRTMLKDALQYAKMLEDELKKSRED